MKYKLFFLMFLIFLVSCSNGQKIFYWERPNTGGAWFARDHEQCLRKADYWPYTFLWPWEWGTSEYKKNKTFDNDAGNGIWAQYVPTPGAQPLYVNSRVGDWSMSPSKYADCMKKRGYKEIHDPVQNRQVFPE